MYLVLPNEKIDDQKTLKALEKVKDLDEIMKTSKIQVRVPKFKIETSYKLKQSLRTLGVNTLFDSSQADLTGLNDNPNDKSLLVDEVVQKAFIEGY